MPHSMHYKGYSCSKLKSIPFCTYLFIIICSFTSFHIFPLFFDPIISFSPSHNLCFRSLYFPVSAQQLYDRRHCCTKHQMKTQVFVRCSIHSAVNEDSTAWHPRKNGMCCVTDLPLCRHLAGPSFVYCVATEGSTYLNKPVKRVLQIYPHNSMCRY